MGIAIPSNEIMFGKGASCFDAFRYLQTWLWVMTKDFPNKYRACVVDDIDSMEANFIYEIVNNLSSLFLLCASQNKDYSAAAVLCRAIADRVVILKLIYANNDSKERTYRYYLYLLDGMKKREKMLKDKIEYNGKISQQEYDELIKQIDDAKENTKDVVRHCIEVLNQHEYAHLDPKFHAVVVRDSNWQYQKFGRFGKNNKTAKYKWEELYTLLDNRETVISMFSTYLSQFVHGLSMVCIPGQNEFENFDCLMGVGVCLQGMVISVLKSHLCANGDFLNNISDSDLEQITSQLSNEHLAEILTGIGEH